MNEASPAGARPDPVAHAAVLRDLYGRERAHWIAALNVDVAHTEDIRRYWLVAKSELERSA